MISTSVLRLDQILKNLFLVSEIKQNEIVPEYVHVKSVLESVLVSFNKEIGEKNFKIVILGEDQNFCIDNKLFQTIIKNIVSNSLTYYRKPEPELRIHFSLTSGSLLLHFWDNGKGIKEEHQSKKTFQVTNN